MILDKLILKIKHPIKYFATKKLNKYLKQIDICSTFFGMAGTGKSSFCAYVVWLCKNSLTPIKVYSNVPIKGAIKFDKQDFGRYNMSNAVILIDEGSLFYDNRNYNQNFNQYSLEYLKLLRHRHNHLLIFSQSVDVDIKFVRMSFNLFQLKKSIFGMTSIKRIRHKLGINKETHQFEEQYFDLNGILGLLTNWRFLRFPFYKLFDSYEAPYLPDMEEHIYGE